MTYSTLSSSRNLRRTSSAKVKYTGVFSIRCRQSFMELTAIPCILRTWRVPCSLYCGVCVCVCVCIRMVRMGAAAKLNSQTPRHPAHVLVSSEVLLVVAHLLPVSTTNLHKQLLSMYSWSPPATPLQCNTVGHPRQPLSNVIQLVTPGNPSPM